jgi:predicted nucleic acid-binding Zn ribbon protein
MSGHSRLYAVSEAPVRRSATPCSHSLGRVARRQRRRRRLAGLVRFAVFLLLIFVAVWAGVRVAHAGDDPAIYTGTAYTVQAGDDLWSIAEAAYGSKADLRAVVYAIREANHIETSVLQPGQDLTLPYLDE